MKFKIFLERDGYFDDKEDTRPHGMGRQQDMPGARIVPGTSTVKGKITNVEMGRNYVKLTLMSDDADVDEEDKSVTTVAIPLRRYTNERDQAPNKGDVIQAELNRDGTLVSYDVIHRL